jgi:RES domain-containing protein
MVLWRISKHLELNGRGGITFAGRWHHAGSPVVYLAESPASALVEACVHTSASDIPPSYTLLKVVGPDLPFDEIEFSALPAGWSERVEITRELGSEWLKNGRTALLRTPSALVPETANFLLNPLHKDAGLFQIEASYLYPFDARLKS